MNKWRIFSMVFSVIGAAAGVIGHFVDGKIQNEEIAKKVQEAIKNHKG